MKRLDDKVAIVTGASKGIGAGIVFLASDDAGWLTGEIIFANGGNK